MVNNKFSFDAIVIGGGFYGCYTALSLRKFFKNVVIIEKEGDLLQRASFVNQARIHNGYHYPRSFLTAYRSAQNFSRFVKDFKESVDSSFEKVYAVSKQNSKVTANQFKKFCNLIGSPIKESSTELHKLFNPDLIEEVFTVKEVAFDAVKLKNNLLENLNRLGVKILTNTEVEKLSQKSNSLITVALKNGDNFVGKTVFNCTYSQINHLLEKSNLEPLPLKHEITEIALIKVPEKLKNLGITIIDGPFFSTMPFPSKGLHSLSHVRYTPHNSLDWTHSNSDAHSFLNKKQIGSNFNYMIKDASRFVPVMELSEYRESLYEVKTVLTSNEIDDGRPILYRENYGLKNLFVIMGGKIDNIYDVNSPMLEKLSSAII